MISFSLFHCTMPLFPTCFPSLALLSDAYTGVLTPITYGLLKTLCHQLGLPQWWWRWVNSFKDPKWSLVMISSLSKASSAYGSAPTETPASFTGKGKSYLPGVGGLRRGLKLKLIRWSSLAPLKTRLHRWKHSHTFIKHFMSSTGRKCIKCWHHPRPIEGALCPWVHSSGEEEEYIHREKIF